MSATPDHCIYFTFSATGKFFFKKNYHHKIVYSHISIQILYKYDSWWCLYKSIRIIKDLCFRLCIKQKYISIK